MEVVQAVFLRYALALALILAWAMPTEAATITVAACTGTNDHTKIQTAINSAVDGDVVQIQAGTCTIGGTISWTNKNIIVQGAGLTSTILNRVGDQGTFRVNVTTASKGDVRIAQMTINQTQLNNNDKTIVMSSIGLGAPVTGRFRLDHLKITQTVHSVGIHIFIEGVWWGLIDHLDSQCAGCLNISGASITDHDYNTGALYGQDSANAPLALGTDTAVYVEDSTFLNDSGSNQSLALNDSTYGFRMVWRHNVSVGNAHWQTHPTYGSQMGGLQSEVYNNHFTGLNRGDKTAFTVSNIRSGAGVFFNNTIDGTWQNVNPFTDNPRCNTNDTCSSINGSLLGTCNGSNSRDGNLEATGWPCFNQIGRNPKNQASLPFYYWNNGPQLKCFDTAQGGAACDGSIGLKLNTGCNTVALALWIKTTPHVNGDKDYCVGTTSMPGSCGNHTNTYTPYTYPHPLQQGGGGGGGGDVTPPVAPRNLQVLP